MIAELMTIRVTNIIKSIPPSPRVFIYKELGDIYFWSGHTPEEAKFFEIDIYHKIEELTVYVSVEIMGIKVEIGKYDEHKF